MRLFQRMTGRAELVEPEFADRLGEVEPTVDENSKWHTGIIEVTLTGSATADVEVRVTGFDGRNLLEGTVTGGVFVWRADDLLSGRDLHLPIPVKLLKG